MSQVQSVLGGNVRYLYSEEIDLAALGSPTISRASHVEPNRHGRWRADLSPVGGPVLRPLDRRSDALAAEQAWLEPHWLTSRQSATVTDEVG
jgi:hypothetical protein